MSTTRKLLSFSMIVGSFLTLAAAPAFAEFAVKVECNGDCTYVTLGQVCASTGASNLVPVSISCDATNWLTWQGVRSCGYFNATCIPYGDYYPSDSVADYCLDGSGNDAVVTCR